MILMEKDMEKIMKKLSKNLQNFDNNKILNRFFNYWVVLRDKENDIKKAFNFDLSTILYSKYYWCTRYIKKYNRKDGGLDQQQFKIFEEIYERLGNQTNWSLLEKIDNS